MAEQSFWDMLRTKRDSLTKSGIIVADYLMQHAEDAQYLYLQLYDDSPLQDLRQH